MNNSKVFVNRTLNLKRISHIGLDMDHTLVRYQSANFESLTYKIMIEKLIRDKHYPKKIAELKFDWNSAIRGLVVDKVKGNLLKLSRFAAIRQSQHGIKKIDFQTQAKIYKSTYIDLSDSEYDTVDTSFSIAFAGLFAQLVDLKDHDPDCAVLPIYSQIATDLNSVLDTAHRDGSIKGIVKKNLDKYIIKEEKLVKGILNYLKHDKVFFIVTNSDFEYSKLLLDYAINPFLPKGKTWQDLFKYVITSAQKPRFFYDDLKFLKIDPATGLMSNMGTEKLSPGVFQGGGARRFTQDLDLEPDEILYVGDHIYGDILRLKKDCAWRTALVVEEIEDEVRKNHEGFEVSNKINSLMNKKLPIEKEIDELISYEIEHDSQAKKSQIDGLLVKINELDHEIGPLIKQMGASHNPQWGELMRAGIEESYFAYQVERFACIYMSKLSDLLELSPRTYYRAFKRIMAHE